MLGTSDIPQSIGKIGRVMENLPSYENVDTQRKLSVYFQIVGDTKLALANTLSNLFSLLFFIFGLGETSTVTTTSEHIINKSNLLWVVSSNKLTLKNIEEVVYVITFACVLLLLVLLATLSRTPGNFGKKYYFTDHRTVNTIQLFVLIKRNSLEATWKL